MNIFEKAARIKLRINCKGMCSTEDLWDLPLKTLDNIYKKLNAKVKAQTEDSLLDAKTAEDEITALQIEIVKHIVLVRVQEAHDRKTLVEKSEEKKRLLEILARKQDQETENLSKEELMARINAL